MATDSGSNFSIAGLMEPLPASCTGVCLDVLPHVDAAVALPILGELLHERGHGEFDDAVLQNVLWKLKTYLPSMFALCYGPGSLNPRLKEFKALVPEATFV